MEALTETSIFYFDSIVREMKLAQDGKLYGNVEFKINFVNGAVASMNISLNKSVKRTEVKVK